jgi:hypothetical protein
VIEHLAYPGMAEDQIVLVLIDGALKLALELAGETCVAETVGAQRVAVSPRLRRLRLLSAASIGP